MENKEPRKAVAIRYENANGEYTLESVKKLGVNDLLKIGFKADLISYVSMAYGNQWAAHKAEMEKIVDEVAEELSINDEMTLHLEEIYEKCLDKKEAFIKYLSED